MDLQEIIGDIETHSVEGIRACFERGVHPNDLYNHRPLIEELTSEYLRSDRFKQCVQLFVDYGLTFNDKPLLYVLLDNADALEGALKTQPQLTTKKYSFKAAFTPLYQATLLHICAEFNHLACAQLLVRYGADVNAAAGIDEFGFGGQSPIFHTVNQIHNHSKEMLLYLLSQGADANRQIKGIIWGKGYDWETFIPAITPLSYAMMGLLPQMHRNERQITEIISLLLKQAYGINYTPANIPNKYLGS